MSRPVPFGPVVIPDRVKQSSRLISLIGAERWISSQSELTIEGFVGEYAPKALDHSNLIVRESFKEALQRGICSKILIAILGTLIGGRLKAYVRANGDDAYEPRQEIFTELDPFQLVIPIVLLWQVLAIASRSNIEVERAMIDSPLCIDHDELQKVCGKRWTIQKVTEKFVIDTISASQEQYPERVLTFKAFLAIARDSKISASVHLLRTTFNARKPPAWRKPGRRPDAR